MRVGQPIANLRRKINGNAFGELTVAFDHLGKRMDELAEHHRERLDEVESAVAAGASTTWEVTRSIKWHRPFETLEPRARRSALGETGSHLIRLAKSGRVIDEGGDSQISPDPPSSRWKPATVPTLSR